MGHDRLPGDPPAKDVLLTVSGMAWINAGAVGLAASMPERVQTARREVPDRGEVGAHAVAFLLELGERRRERQVEYLLCEWFYPQITRNQNSLPRAPHTRVAHPGGIQELLETPWPCYHPLPQLNIKGDDEDEYGDTVP